MIPNPVPAQPPPQPTPPPQKKNKKRLPESQTQWIPSLSPPLSLSISLLAGETLKANMECASGWGKVREKMKCASGWGKVKNFFFFFFRKCASGWGNSKKDKMKDGGNHVCAQGIDTQT